MDDDDGAIGLNRIRKCKRACGHSKELVPELSRGVIAFADCAEQRLREVDDPSDTAGPWVLEQPLETMREDVHERKIEWFIRLCFHGNGHWAGNVTRPYCDVGVARSMPLIKWKEGFRWVP